MLNRTFLIQAVLLTTMTVGRAAYSYPVDGFDETGIPRLEGYYYSLQTPSGKRSFVPGQLLSMMEVGISLQRRSFPVPPADKAFSQDLAAILGPGTPSFSFAVLDLSDPRNPVYGGVNDQRPFMPGSTGKVLVALALFQELDNLYPSSGEQRVRLLRNSMVTADDFAVPDTHDVPIWHPETRTIDFRPVAPGDRASLWTYLDWMLSASSNAAGSMVLRELVLLRHFGHAYPPEDYERQRFLSSTPRQELAAIVSRSVREAVSRNHLDPDSLYHGSFFTRGGKTRIPSNGSTATARELVRFLLLMEQGRLIDEFSSLELKRLLYSTQTRIRYAASPELDLAAVYYKSGSQFSCRKEPGFGCRQYHGNALNLMNSAAIVEYPAESPQYRYMVVLSSNVLRKNSSDEHARIAADLQRLIEQRHQNRRTVPPRR